MTSSVVVIVDDDDGQKGNSWAVFVRFRLRPKGCSPRHPRLPPLRVATPMHSAWVSGRGERGAQQKNVLNENNYMFPLLFAPRAPRCHAFIGTLGIQVFRALLYAVRAACSGDGTMVLVMITHLAPIFAGSVQ